MRVYSEDGDAFMDVDADDAVDAAREAHAATAPDEDGCVGVYCVEVRPGTWRRFRVRTRVEIAFDATDKGECDAPEVQS